MILGSITSALDSIVQPFANVFGWVLAGFFSFTHSYGWSIILLTLAVMVIVFPLTRAGTRSMMRMQLLQPELMRIRNKYKAQPGMSTEERQQSRSALNEEMMALYRENGVNPTGGCLPMFLQFPIFIVLYDVIRGMTRELPIGPHHALVLKPQYIPIHTQLYHAVVTSHGKLDFLGVNLADSVRSPGSLAGKIPYVVVILIAVVLQYVSIWQITNRNPTAAQANKQMQMVQKFMPLIFVVIYIEFPAGIGLYFIISSLFRIGQQEYMYKHDPKIVESVKELHKRKAIEAKAVANRPPRAPGERPRGFRERLREAAAGLQGTANLAPEPEPEKPTPAKKGARTSAQATNGVARSKSNGVARPNGGSGASARKKAESAASSQPRPNVQNRSRAKKPRR